MKVRQTHKINISARKRDTPPFFDTSCSPKYALKVSIKDSYIYFIVKVMSWFMVHGDFSSLFADAEFIDP